MSRRTLPLRFLRDRRATAATEFALLLPVILILYIGFAVVGDMLTANRRVDRLASSIGDLLARVSEVSNADVDAIFDIAVPMLAPYDAGRAEIIVADVRFQADGRNADGSTRYAPEVRWARGENATAPACGDDPPVAIPATLVPTSAAAANQDVIIAQVVYRYRSPFTSLARTVLGEDSFVFEHSYILRPRASLVVVNTSVAGC